MNSDTIFDADAGLQPRNGDSGSMTNGKLQSAAEQNGTSHFSAERDTCNTCSCVTCSCVTCSCVTCSCVKKAILCVVMVVVWMLLSLPIIFYHLPTGVMVAEVSASNGSNSTGEECSSAAPYPTPGGVCQTALADTLLSMNCDSGGTTLVLRDEESTASDLISKLNFLSPSPECREAVLPFLCVFLFGLCDGSGVSIQPTSGQCEQLRDGVCREEWALALSFGVDLPDCGVFPTEPVSCPAPGGSDSSPSGSGLPPSEDGLGSGLDDPMNESKSQPLNCREGFFREDPSSTCFPSCFTWLQYPTEVSIFIDVVVFLAAFIGFFSGVAVLVISFFRYKRMFVFPSIFVIYMTIDLMLLAFFVLVNYMDRNSLFCTSMNLIESFMKVTPFCVLSGIVFTYTLAQLSVWWLFHTTSLFWKIYFPFHARSFEMSHKIKYIHAACIVAGIVLPMVPIVTSVGDSAMDFMSNSTDTSFINSGLGFRQTRFPAILCTGSNSDSVFYSVVLPIDIMLAFGCPLLIVIFWIIHKQNGIFRANDKSKVNYKIGTAERKILIVFCYYVLLASIALTTFTISTRNAGTQVTKLIEYFMCEQNGHNTSSPCSRSKFEALNQPGLTTLSFVLLGLFPVVNLLYAVNIQELKERWHACSAKAKWSISDNPSTGSSALNSSTLRKV